MRQAVKRCFREIFYVPDAYRGFYRPACGRALEIIQQQPIDLIFTTSGPYTLLRVGRSLTLQTGIPWVADFRDLWVENHFGYPYSGARRLLDSFLQCRWLSNACRITTATEGLKARLQASGYAGKRIDCVYNGYLEAPPEASLGCDPADPGELRICFTGKLYEHPAYTVAQFFEALARVRDSQPTVFRRLRADFFGIVNTDFVAQLERFGLRDVVRFHGMVSRDEAVRAQAAADVLFLLVPNTREQEVAVYSKTFEYMAAQKPLLAIIPEAGEAARVLARAGMGRIFAPHETEAMAEYLAELQVRKERLGRLPPQGDSRVIGTFSYRSLARRLADVFDAAIRERSAATAGTRGHRGIVSSSGSPGLASARDGSKFEVDPVRPDKPGESSLHSDVRIEGKVPLA
jgi:glycosyltransferase involved in cell wall biosynthesis